MTHTSCPRCGRRMSVMSNGKVRRHKNAGGEWCNGEAKTSFELMLDVLDSVRAERDVLTHLFEGYQQFSDLLLDSTRAFVDARERSSALIEQTTERIHFEVALLKERGDSLVASVQID